MGAVLSSGGWHEPVEIPVGWWRRRYKAIFWPRC